MTEGDKGLMRVRWAACAALSAVAFFLGSCGGTSNNPTPTVSALYPETIPATLVGPPACTSNPSFTVNVSGNNFLDTSVVYWNGSKRATTFNQNSGELAVTILACDIANPGIDYISVVNPPPGGGPSQAAAPFQVTQPTPAAIKSLSPASTTQNILPPGGTLTINGEEAESGSSTSAFASNSQVSINGSARATTFVSSTQLQAQLLPSDVATVGNVSVTVTNPGLRSGSSTAQFSVTDPPNAANFPRVISVSASGGAANGASSSPAMSADGRYVAFYSEATNLVASGASGNIFVRDTCIGATASCTPHTIAVDLAPDGSAPNAKGEWKIAMSADGRYIAFSSSARNLLDSNAEAPDSENLTSNVFVRDSCLGVPTSSRCSPHTTQISQGLGSEEGNDDSSAPSISSDGRFVAFQSYATNLVEGVGQRDGRVYVADLCSGSVSTQCTRQTYLVSPENVVTSDFVEQNVSISGNGRYVGFTGLPNGNRFSAQAYLRDTCLGKDAPQSCAPSTSTLSVGPDLVEGNGPSSWPSVSADGRFVVFATNASNLVPSVTDESDRPHELVVVRDTCLGPSAPKTCIPSTSVVPLDPSFSQMVKQTFVPSISASGRYISFGATLSAPNNPAHALVRDTCYGVENSACVPYTTVVSVNPRGELGNDTTLSQVAVSKDGRLVAFGSNATNLAAPTSGLGDVFLMQMPTAITQH